MYFVCDPQLDDIKTRRLVRRLLICGGRVIFTGTVEPNTHASLLLHAGKAQLLRYSVHCTQADMLRIAAQNHFDQIIAYNSDFAPTKKGLRGLISSPIKHNAPPFAEKQRGALLISVQ